MAEEKKENKYVSINMYLDFTNFPTVAGVLEDLLATNQFGDFVYFSIEHMLKNSEEYGTEQQQALLDTIYEIIGALNGTVEDISDNVLDLMEEVGVHSTLLQKGVKKEDIEEMLKTTEINVPESKDIRDKVDSREESTSRPLPRMELPELDIEEESVNGNQSPGSVLLQEGDEDLFDF